MRQRIKFDKKAVENYAKIGGTPWLYKSHTVFGQVYEGYDVLDTVAGVELIDEDNGIPKEKVIIETIKIFDYAEEAD